jgi:DNA-binding MarR family transcriptional regulator
MTLQEEIKKRTPFDLPEQEAVLNLFRTTDQLQIRFARLFRRFGLTPQQYNILRILRGEGNPLPVLDVAERMITVVPGITGLVDRMQTAGLVVRRRCSQDRRVVYVAITIKGSDLLAQIDEPLLAMHQELLGHLSGEELTLLSRLLEKVRAPLVNR